MRHRRTEAEMVRDLEAQIAALRGRAERKRVRKDPAMRQVLLAVKSLDKATSETKDSAMRKAIEEARTTLSACLALSGIVVPQIGVVQAKRTWKRKKPAMAQA